MLRLTAPCQEHVVQTAALVEYETGCGIREVWDNEVLHLGGVDKVVAFYMVKIKNVKHDFSVDSD